MFLDPGPSESALFRFSDRNLYHLYKDKKLAKARNFCLCTKSPALLKASGGLHTPPKIFVSGFSKVFSILNLRGND
jgi:hypothetical protein